MIIDLHRTTHIDHLHNVLAFEYKFAKFESETTIVVSSANDRILLLHALSMSFTYKIKQWP